MMQINLVNDYNNKESILNYFRQLGYETKLHLYIINNLNENFATCRRTSQSWVRESSVLVDDGHAWRKYGQKVILNAKHPRYHQSFQLFTYIFYLFT